MIVLVGGHHSAFTFFGLLGMSAAVIGLYAFRNDVRRSLAQVRAKYGRRSKGAPSAMPVEPLVPMSRLVPALAQLLWAHSCIGFGFFVLQSWIPTFFVREFNASG